MKRQHRLSKARLSDCNRPLLIIWVKSRNADVGTWTSGEVVSSQFVWLARRNGWKYEQKSQYELDRKTFFQFYGTKCACYAAPTAIFCSTAKQFTIGQKGYNAYLLKWGLLYPINSPNWHRFKTSINLWVLFEVLLLESLKRGLIILDVKRCILQTKDKKLTPISCDSSSIEAPKLRGCVIFLKTCILCPSQNS